METVVMSTEGCSAATALYRGTNGALCRAAASMNREAEREDEAICRSLAALQEAEQLGAEDARLAGSLRHLARLYQERNNPGEAEPLLERALAVQEKALGPEHPVVAITLTNLMFLYRHQGKETEAVAVAARARSILATRIREIAHQ